MRLKKKKEIQNEILYKLYIYIHTHIMGACATFKERERYFLLYIKKKTKFKKVIFFFLPTQKNKRLFN